MKKLLSLLASIGLSASIGSSVVSCAKPTAKLPANDLVAFSKNDVTLNPNSLTQTVSVNIGDNIDNLSANIVKKNDKNNNVKASYDSTNKSLKLTVSKDWKFSEDLNVNISLQFSLKDKNNQQIITSNSLKVFVEKNADDDQFDLASYNPIVFDESKLTGTEIKINMGENIDSTSIKVTLKGRDAKFIDASPRIDQNGLGLNLEIDVKDQFEWGFALDASVQLTANLKSDYSKTVTTSSVEISSVTDWLARKVTWEQDGGVIQLFSKDEHPTIGVDAGEDVDLNSEPIIKVFDENSNEINPNNLHTKITYNKEDTSFELSVADNWNMQKTLPIVFIQATFKLKSEPNTLTTTDLIGMQTFADQSNDVLKFSEDRPYLKISEDKPDNETNFIIGSNIASDSLKIGQIVVPNTSGSADISGQLAPDFEIQNTILNNQEGNIKIVATEKWNFEKQVKFYIPISYKLNNDDTVYSTNILVQTETSQEARSFIFSKASGDDARLSGNPITYMDLSVDSPKKNIYIVSKNADYSDIDWDTFNVNVNIQNNPLKNVSFTTNETANINAYGGTFSLQISSGWEYLSDQNFDLNVSFKLISEPEITVKNNLKIHVSKSKFYDWNTKSKTAEVGVISSWLPPAYGYLPTVAIFDLDYIGKGIDLNSVAIYDSNGNRMIPEDMTIVIVDHNGIPALKIWPTRKYIDSLVSNNNMQKTVTFTVSMKAKTFPSQLRTRQVSITFADSYYGLG